MTRTAGTLRAPGPRAAGALLALCLTGCFEPPVAERIEIRFLRGGPVVIGVAAEFASEEEFKNRPLARERIRRAQTGWMEGTDAWSRRFDALGPLPAERVLGDFEKGRLRRVSRRALLDDPLRLAAFFSDTLVLAAYRSGEDWAEFSLVPQPGGRATSRQRERLRREMIAWSERIATHLVAVRELYRHLEDHPDRAEPCLGWLFHDTLPDPVRESLPGLTGEEKRIVAAAQEAMHRVLDVFSVPPEESETLVEISRLAYDPFPAPLSMGVEGDVIETEGLHRDGTRWVAPVVDAWEGWRSVSERWVAPDPAVAYYEWLRTGHRRDGFDHRAFAGRPRRSPPPPTASEVLSALEGALRSEVVYRIRWKPAAPVEGEDPLAGWDAPLAGE